MLSPQNVTGNITDGKSPGMKHWRFVISSVLLVTVLLLWSNTLTKTTGGKCQVARAAAESAHFDTQQETEGHNSK